MSATLVQPQKSDYEKVRMIFRWILTNIEFDHESYQHSQSSSQHPLVVFQSKKALSKGYADLFSVLCQNNELECRSLKGYTFGFDSLKEAREYPNHYWNVVKIDGFWYLLDIPMILGKMEAKKFVKSYSEDFFLTPP